ncbi:SPX-domain-containing protein [Ramicandelaber brevisporus]|nr:SPX-domain-containing protein [Ramicandelaber brevisporus]
MKFERSLQLNSVPDWSGYYLAYSNLKKLIYKLERTVLHDTLEELAKQCAEYDADSPQALANDEFLPVLEKELARVATFYASTEGHVVEQAASLIGNIQKWLDRRFGGDGQQQQQQQQQRVQLETTCIEIDEAETVADDVGAAWFQPSPRLGARVATSIRSPVSGTFGRLATVNEASNGNEHRGVAVTEENDVRLIERVEQLYFVVSDLISFAELNTTGFRKIVKKYDKVTGNSLTPSFLGQVLSRIYMTRAQARNRLHGAAQSLENAYVALAAALNNVSRADALSALRSRLHAQVVLERTTIWRDMIGQERERTGAELLALPSAVEQAAQVHLAAVDEQLEAELVCGGVRRTLRKLSKYANQAAMVAVCTAIFAVVQRIPMFESAEQQNCFALLVYASLLWGTEALPLFVTALFVPMLVVMLRVLRAPVASHNPHDPPLFRRMEAPEASKLIFSSMFSSVIVLLLGGFTLAAALSKHNVARTLAAVVLSKAGTKPSTVLLANMLVATFASMWISNVAAPVLCFSLIQPILRTLPPGHPFGPCLILGIALASNIGGMTSPISSPQNIIAIANMDPAPSWLQWFIVALPVSAVCDVVVWALLLAVYQPEKPTTADTIHATDTSSNNGIITPERQMYVTGVTLLTIALWCVGSRLAPVVGDMGVIAIVPMLFFFGPGILTKEDFNGFLWTVVILAMGGTALGKAVESSGLLFTLASHMKALVAGMTIWQVTALFSGLVLVVATFISHTVAAMIVLPIVAQPSWAMMVPPPHGHANMLVMTCALMCSGAMGLPVSGFPNMNAIMLENELGIPYLTTFDFIKAGIPASVLAYGTIVTLGYWISAFIGF